MTATGDFRLQIESINRLIMQSGLSMGLTRIAMIAGIGTLVLFGTLIVVRGSIGEAALISMVAGLFMPFLTLRMLRGRRQKKFGAQFPDAIDIIVKETVAAGNTDPIWHARSRPMETEAEATNRAIQLAHVAGAPLYVVHVSCQPSDGRMPCSSPG